MVDDAKRKKNRYQAFYTECSIITQYMIDLLQCESNSSILEPCAGEGAFLRAMKKLSFSPKIHALELNYESALFLKNFFLNEQNIIIENTDFLFRENLPYFDRIIANPPYGAYLDIEKRKILKNKYPNANSKETYNLFLIKSLGLLRKEGRLVFIIPDTFMNTRMHENLRKELLHNHTIESITLFPSNFFPGINFGYAGLSIISVVKSEPLDSCSFPVYFDFKSKNDLINKKCNFKTTYLFYKNLKNNPYHSFYLHREPWVEKILLSKYPKLHDFCDVVTGFYSGNDLKHLKRAPTVTRGSKYELVNPEQIWMTSSEELHPPLSGVKGEKIWIPIVKGGNKRFFKPTEWYMEWSEDSIHEYRIANKKKARFQNSQYYFREGIAVPMVSSILTASLLNQRLFDQSIVAIFPRKKESNFLFFILGLLNSNVCNSIIRTLNSSTNNSANYIKNIPLVIPDAKELDIIACIVKNLYNLSKKSKIHESDMIELNSYYDRLYSKNI